MTGGPRAVTGDPRHGGSLLRGRAGVILAWMLLLAVPLAVPARLRSQEKPAETPAPLEIQAPLEMEVPAENAAPMETPVPVEQPGVVEMARLKFYLGEWDYTESYPKSAYAPNGMKNTGVYTSKLGPGGLSLINTFHSQGPAGDFEGLLVMTWDANEKSYKMYALNSASPGAVVETGQFEGDVLVYRAELSSEGTSLKLRNTTRLTADGKLESEQYVSVNGGPEKLLVQVEAKKR